VTAYLLDVNVLIALAWPQHSLHSLARAWFRQQRTKGWATCPMVEAGFVRIVSNPNFSPRSVPVPEAVEALQAGLKDRAHQFWPDSISLPEVLEILQQPIKGHKQITDAYLVALAIKNRGKLATLDRRVAALAPAGVVEVIE
jgi:uncharacterized protein